MTAFSSRIGAIGLASAGALWLISVHATPPDGDAFVKAFEEVCIPQRLSYEGTLSVAADLRWTAMDPAKYPTFEQFASYSKEILDQEIAEDPELLVQTKTDWLTRDIQGRVYLLGVNLLETEVIDTLGCYLYDFGATHSIDPSLVTQMLHQPVAYSTDKKAEGFEPMREIDPAIMVMTVWGPPHHLPRTLDTRLMFVPEDSVARDETGFTGLALSTSTSLPSWEARQKQGS